MTDIAEGLDRAVAAIEAPIRSLRADADRYRHLEHLKDIAQEDIEQLNQKEREYGASWKKRGGVGAFMMLARKWDRLENMVDELKTYHSPFPGTTTIRQAFVAGPYDIFSHVEGSNLQGDAAESLIDTIGDLRRYLMLVEAEMRAQNRSRPVSVSTATLTNQGELVATTEHINDRPGMPPRVTEGPGATA